ncbi:MAG: DUF427 domain-containing protein [Ornithinibacter sp.]
MRAIWNDKVIAESDATVVVEGNHYVPLASVDQEVLRPSATQSVCPWKGTASYWSLEVDGQSNTDAAWVYREPKDAAAQIKDHVAFWKGVTVQP